MATTANAPIDHLNRFISCLPKRSEFIRTAPHWTVSMWPPGGAFMTVQWLNRTIDLSQIRLVSAMGNPSQLTEERHESQTCVGGCGRVDRGRYCWDVVLPGRGRRERLAGHD